MKLISKSEAIATISPSQWMNDFNMTILSPKDQKGCNSINIYKTQIITKASKMYIEKLIVHPMKFILTFNQSPFPRQKQYSFQTTAFNILTSLAGVDRMQIKLKSFEVEDVMESTGQ